MKDRIPYLKALTPEAKAALAGDLQLLPQLPFRVGRESRSEERGALFADSRRQVNSMPNNDLYLPEAGSELNVSREHFLIDFQDGQYVCVDRGSSCGTIVEGEPIGSKRPSFVRKLENHDVIVVGTSRSKYVFKFLVKGE